MFQQQQQQQLPTNYLLHPEQPWGPQFYPQLPNIRVADKLQPYLGVIAGLLAREFTMGAKTNPHPGRVLTYNLLGANNFNTSSFHEALAFACDLITVQLIRTNGHPNDVIPQAVVIVSAMWTSQVVVNYWNSGLASVCPPDIYQAAVAGVRELQETAAMINQMQMMSNGGMGSGNMQYGQPQQQNALLNNFGNRYGGGLTGNTSTGLYGGGNNSGGFHGNNGIAAEMDSRFGDVNNTRYQQERAPEPVRQEYRHPFTSVPAPAMQQEDEPAEVHDDLFDEVLVWKPSRRQPYRPAYDPSKFTTVLAMREGDVVVEVIKMQEADHEIPGRFPLSDRDVQVSVKNMTVISKALDTVLPVEEVVQEEYDAVSTYVRKAWSVETSIDQLLMVTDLARLVLAKDNKLPMIYVAKADVVRVFVSTTNFEDVVADLLKSETSVHMSEKLNELRDTIDEAVFKFLDGRFTEIANNVVRKKIGMNAGIDSFVDDNLLLVKGLSKRSTELAQLFDATFMADVRLGITVPATGEDGKNDVYDAILSNLIDVDDVTGYRGKVTRIGQSVAVAQIDAPAGHLAVTYDGTTGRIDKETTPLLYKVLETLVLNLDDSEVIERFLIRTRDAVVLEITKGVMADGAWLISEAKL